jgi:predicted adenylyl cyclase CyaB
MPGEQKIETVEEVKLEETKAKLYLEVEVKYNAEEIDRIVFKDLAKSLSPKSFIYVESTDIYYAKSENDFLRHRLPAQNKGGAEENRSELTFKKKIIDQNNWSRVEVNLRVDQNDPKLVEAFCEGLGYKRNFSIQKNCDIYFWDDADIVYYTVKDEDGKYSNFCEIEASEDIGMTQEESWAVVLKYEKLLAPLGITPQKRKKLSLWEIYRKGFKKE